MAKIYSEKSPTLENWDAQNLGTLEDKTVWIEVKSKYPGISHLMCSFQIEKWIHPNVQGGPYVPVLQNRNYQFIHFWIEISKYDGNIYLNICKKYIISKSYRGVA